MQYSYRPNACSFQHGLGQKGWIGDPWVVRVAVCEDVGEAMQVQDLPHFWAHPRPWCPKETAPAVTMSQGLAYALSAQQGGLKLCPAIFVIWTVCLTMVGNLMPCFHQCFEACLMPGHIVSRQEEGGLCPILIQDLLNLIQHGFAVRAARRVIECKSQQAVRAVVEPWVGLGVKVAQRPWECKVQHLSGCQAGCRDAPLVKSHSQR
mmetsp:Transcript_48929/g.114491  ORF Transcript_48929/g.114491 Transcript_48929/m.114491 type:complete len:206 (+) Transcript_48929:152-769(+)